jgi:membrane fusion protein, multidrug efflux system
LDKTSEEPTLSARPKVIAILALVAFALLLAAVLAFAFVKGERSTDDAYVTGHQHTISSRVSGTVQEVLVDDNQFVRAGQVLARLDTRDFDVQVALQRSRVEQARSEQDSARAQISQTEAAIAAATADARKGDLNFARARALTAETPRGLSQQDFDAADAARTTAHARVR